MIKRSAPVRPATLLALFATVLACALVAAWFVYGQPETGVDDAVIAFIYADHLQQGHGFVYNVGGERVEGFTSLLWVLITSGVLAVFGQVEAPLYIVNLVLVSLATATAAWVLGTHARLESEPTSGLSYSIVLFLAWLVASPAYVGWSLLSLLEVGLYGSLILLGASLLVLMAFHERPDRSYLHLVFSGVIAALVLTRPESIVIAPIFIALAFLVWSSRIGVGGGARRALLPCLAFAATLGAITSFRLWYFGFPLPNTYYAKVSDDLTHNLAAGGRYLVKFLHQNKLALIPLAAALVGTPSRAVALLRIRRRDQSFEERGRMVSELVLGLLVLSLTVVPTLAGGDHFAQSRFYQPLWPLLAMYLLVRAPRDLRSLARRRSADGHGHRLALAGLSAVVAFGLAAGVRWDEVRRDSDDSFALEFHVSEWGRESARHLAAAVGGQENPPAVGVICAGGFKRGYPFEVVDLMGLNHVRMGHSTADRYGPTNHAAFDPSVFFELSPELLMIDCGDFGQPCFPAGSEYARVDAMLKGLLGDADFVSM